MLHTLLTDDPALSHTQEALSLTTPARLGTSEPAVAHGDAAAEVGVRVGGGGCADWWLGAIDLLVRNSPSQGDNVADHIKEQLMERDRYIAKILSTIAKEYLWLARRHMRDRVCMQL